MTHDVERNSLKKYVNLLMALVETFSHEIRNPLNSIINLGSHLKKFVNQDGH